MNLNNEIRLWHGYPVGADGTIYSKVSPTKALRPVTKAGGYLGLHLRVNGRDVNAKLHRVVAEAFIPNPENKPQVNHKDGDKTNNRVTNLEWATSGENLRHAHRAELNLGRYGHHIWYTNGTTRETQRSLGARYGVANTTLRHRLARGLDINTALGLAERRWWPE